MSTSGPPPCEDKGLLEIWEDNRTNRVSKGHLCVSAGSKVMETEAVWSEGWKKDGLICDKHSKCSRTPQRTLRPSAHRRRGCGQPHLDTGNRLGLSSGPLVKRSGMSLRMRPGVCLHMHLCGLPQCPVSGGSTPVSPPARHSLLGPSMVLFS